MRGTAVSGRSVLVGALVALAGCGGGGDDRAAPYVELTVLSVAEGGAAPFGPLQQARVCADSSCAAVLDDASVSVNGSALTYVAERERYEGTVSVALGAAVTAQVTVDGETYTASGTQFTSVPAVSVPTAGTAWDIATAHTISWTGGAPTEGAAFLVGVVDAGGAFAFPAGEPGPAEVAMGTTSSDVPAGALAAGSHQVVVGIGSARGVAPGAGIAFAGAAPGSAMWLGAFAVAVPVTLSGVPSAPADVRATAADGEVRVSWSPVAGATSYDLYWSTEAGVTKTNGTRIQGVTSPALLTELANGTTYHYVVTAVNGVGESAESLEVTATPALAPFIRAMAVSTEDAAPPFAPLQIQVCSDDTCSTRIPDATVLVNGNALTWEEVTADYRGTAAIPVGASVTAEVTVGHRTYSATGTQFAAFPVVTAPASGATWLSTSANDVSWSGGAPTAGAAYVFALLDPDGGVAHPNQGYGPQELDLSTSSVTVPADALEAGTFRVMVGITSAGVADGTFGGVPFTEAAPGSAMWLGAIASLVPVTVQ
jgi:hypothetical protein